MKYAVNSPTFVILYIIFMLPSYFLPFIGSNSITMNAATSAIGIGMSPQFLVHLASLLLLCTLGLLRGRYVDKQWIVIFPALALVFDLMPGLSFVPFVPTVMHLIVMIVGVSSIPKASQ